MLDRTMVNAFKWLSFIFPTNGRGNFSWSSIHEGTQSPQQDQQAYRAAGWRFFNEGDAPANFCLNRLWQSCRRT